VTSPAPKPARRRGDVHAIAVREELEELRRQVEDLLLAARVVAIVVGLNGVLNVLDALA
jgi:hypothetical protein